MYIMASTDDNPRVYGNIIGTTFIKEVKRERNYTKKIKSWYLNMNIFIKEIAPRTKHIVLFDKENQVYYKTTTQKLKTMGNCLIMGSITNISLGEIHWDKTYISPSIKPKTNGPKRKTKEKPGMVPGGQA